MSGVLITQGTSVNIQTDLVGTTNYQIVKLDRGAAGLSSLFTGTIDGLTNIAGGTITALSKGTISAGTVNTGTVNTGTVDAISQFPPNQWQINTTVGTSLLGTIKAAVAGSAIFITDLMISAGTSTALVIGMGGTSTPFMGTMNFATQGGMAFNFRQPGSVTLGSALVYQQSANNTLTIFAQGFVR